MCMIDHLKSRHLNSEKYHMSYDNELVTFYLYNLSGQLVGYQNYRPGAPKTLNNDPKEGRYYTYSLKTEGHPGNRKTYSLAVWGLETIHYTPNVLFLTEGIFDACRLHNLGLSAIAMLSNDPKGFRSWLHTMKDKLKVAVCDNDAAGQKLTKIADVAVFVDSTKDLGEMSESELNNFFINNLRKYVS